MKDTSQTGRHAAPPAAPTAEPAPRKPARDRRKESILGGTALVFVLLLILAFALRGAEGERRYKAQLRNAEDCYAAGDYEGALASLRQAAVRNETEEILLRMVDCYEAMGNYDRALELLRSMNTQDEEIRERIHSLENAREQLRQAGKISIAGQEYDGSVRSLVLRGVTLTEEDLTKISGLYALSSLTLAEDGLTDLSALSGLGGLTMLDLSGNAVTDLSPLDSLSGLRTLYLDRNPITDFSPLYGLRELSMLSIREIEISEAQLAELSQALPQCAIHSETATAEVRDLTLGGVTFREDVTELYLSGLQLSDLSALSGCRELRRLDLSGNKISDLAPLMDLPQLEWLNIADNQVSDLRPLMAMKSLQTVDASRNSITGTAALSSLTELQELHLAGNELSDLSGLSPLSKLETLDLNNARLHNEDLDALKGLRSLKYLDITDNPELTGEAVDALKRSISSCYVEHSRLVYTVELNGERYRQDLTVLEISGTGKAFDLSDIVLLSSLEKLDLSGDALENIYSLRPLSKLRELDLSDNEISDITPVGYLFDLEKLDLSNNHISTITALLNLENLKELDVSGNDLTPELIEKLVTNLPGCKITHD